MTEKPQDFVRVPRELTPAGFDPSRIVLPSGWALVLIQPTEAMIAEGEYHNHRHNSLSNMVESYKAMVRQADIDRMEARSPAYRAMIEAAPAAQKEWRCFQCDEVFTNEDDARGHFGSMSVHPPACCDPLKSDVKWLRNELARMDDLWREALRQRDDAQARVKQLEAAPAAPGGWMPIETVPDGVDVEICSANGSRFIARWNPDCKWFERHEGGLRPQIIGAPRDGPFTHWAPLPPAPGDGRDELTESEWNELEERLPQSLFRSICRAVAAPAAPGGWRTIETAPKDGTKFDAWAVHPPTGTMGVRFTDVQMRGDGSGFGVIIHRPGVHWEYLEQDGPTYPEWKLTHWRPLLPAPGDGRAVPDGVSGDSPASAGGETLNESAGDENSASFGPGSHASHEAPTDLRPAGSDPLAREDGNGDV